MSGVGGGTVEFRVICYRAGQMTNLFLAFPRAVLLETADRIREEALKMDTTAVVLDISEPRCVHITSNARVVEGRVS